MRISFKQAFGAALLLIVALAAAAGCTEEGSSAGEQCEALDCAEQNRSCDESTGRCGPCEAGYAEDDEGECVQTGASCEPGSDNGIAEQCAEENRSCEVGDDGATCGDCVDGYERVPGGACVPFCEALDCADLGRACASDADERSCGDCESGVAANPGDPLSRCVEDACPDGEAHEASTDECVSCPDFSGMEGCAGGNVPVATNGGRCICATEPGYYWEPADLSPRTCDADGDGWVYAEAWSVNQRDDDALQAAANCEWSEIEAFVLQNEAGQQLRLTLDELSGGAMQTLVLQEEAFQDDDAELARAYAGQAPYEGSRKLGLHSQASSEVPADAINGLTKLCTDDTSDFNGNGTPDVRESEELVEATNREELFARMSFFAELHESWFVPGEQGSPGELVIAERARTSNSFPADYGEGTGDHWQQCLRFRDVRADEDDASRRVGSDFAQFSPAPSGDRIDSADDTDWLGMTHSSQFKCVNLLESEPAEASERGAHVVLEDDVHEYAINACDFHSSVSEPTGAPDDSVTLKRIDLECEVTDTPLVNTVYLAAVEYVAGSNYERGCVDECATFQIPDDPASPYSTCPGAATGSSACTPLAGDFGRRICGCSIYTGGADCQEPCTPQLLSRNRTYDVDTREGYWLCGEVTGSDNSLIAGESTDNGTTTGWTVQGGVSPTGHEGHRFQWNP
jgi:hypothetical protein